MLKRYVWHVSAIYHTSGTVSCPSFSDRATRRDMLRHQNTQSQRMNLCISSVYEGRVKICFPCQNHCHPLLIPPYSLCRLRSFPYKRKSLMPGYLRGSARDGRFGTPGVIGGPSPSEPIDQAIFPRASQISLNAAV